MPPSLCHANTLGLWARFPILLSVFLRHLISALIRGAITARALFQPIGEFQLIFLPPAIPPPWGLTVLHTPLLHALWGSTVLETLAPCPAPQELSVTSLVPPLSPRAPLALRATTAPPQAHPSTPPAALVPQAPIATSLAPLPPRAHLALRATTAPP